MIPGRKVVGIINLINIGHIGEETDTGDHTHQSPEGQAEIVEDIEVQGSITGQEGDQEVHPGHQGDQGEITREDHDTQDIHPGVHPVIGIGHVDTGLINLIGGDGLHLIQKSRNIELRNLVIPNTKNRVI